MEVPEVKSYQLVGSLTREPLFNNVGKERQFNHLSLIIWLFNPHKRVTQMSYAAYQHKHSHTCTAAKSKSARGFRARMTQLL